MSKSVALRHFQAALSKWPKDTVRPEISFTKAMNSRIQRRFGLPSNGSSPATQQTVPVVDEAAELEQANALYSLVEDRYAKRYEVSKDMVFPQSNPDYYRNIMNEIEEVPERSRFQNWLNGWKGFLRWK